MSNQWRMVPVDLLEKCAERLERADSGFPGSVPFIAELRAALSAPVPPAGDVEVVVYACGPANRRSYIEPGNAFLGWHAHDATPLADRAHLTRLTADCEALAVMHRQAQIQWAAERDALNTLLGYASEALKFTGLQDHLVDFEFVESVKATIDQRLQGLKANGAANAEG